MGGARGRAGPPQAVRSIAGGGPGARASRDDRTGADERGEDRAGRRDAAGARSRAAAQPDQRAADPRAPGARLDGDRADKKVEKWPTGAIEAAKQCGNPWLPEIAPLLAFRSFLTSASGYDLKLIASLHAGTTTLKQALATYSAKHGHAPRTVLWLVGPEGDFSPTEMTAAITAGCSPITLGPLVLRSDTAAVYALSILSHELQHSR